MLDKISIFKPVIPIIILHIVDMWCTRKYIIKCRTKYQNPEILEMNYHRWFMKLFGMNTGVIMSFILSSTIMISIGLMSWYNNRPFYYMIIGTLFMVGHLNIRYAYGYEKREEKLIYKEKYLKDKLKALKQ